MSLAFELDGSFAAILFISLSYLPVSRKRYRQRITHDRIEANGLIRMEYSGRATGIQRNCKHRSTIEPQTTPQRPTAFMFQYDLVKGLRVQNLSPVRQ